MQLQDKKKKMIDEGIAEIQQSAMSLSDITGQEKLLVDKCEVEYQKGVEDFEAMYIVKELISSPDDLVRSVTTNLASDKYVLSKVHSKYAKIETEQDRLSDLVPRAIYELKDAILECKMREVRQRIKELGNMGGNVDELRELMTQNMELQQIRSEFAKFLGERIVAPRK